MHFRLKGTTVLGRYLVLEKLFTTIIQNKIKLSSGINLFFNQSRLLLFETRELPNELRKEYFY